MQGSGDNIYVNGEDTQDPGKFGVPDGAPVWPSVDVKLGDQHDGSFDDGLIYTKGLDNLANYHIWGVSEDSHLRLTGANRRPRRPPRLTL